ncbi:MAG: PDZ domain-containing protein [Streptococcaceae bacterium]|jgi:carboxyl-terminal processing protease|nr:PDZ domain-containing protein [Streptococcaceae bacterium]
MKKEKKYISFTKYVISLVCVVILTGAGFYMYFNNIYQREMKRLSLDSNMRRIHSFYREIQENYFGDIQMNDVTQAALQGMSDALNDPYSSYLNEEDSQRLSESLQGSFGGIGASLGMVEGRPTIVQAPNEETPAFKAGLKQGDVMLKVEGASVEGKTVSEIVALIRGEEGSKVNLTIERNGEEMDFTLTRAAISIPSVYYRLDEENKEIGSISISLFNQTTTKEMKDAIVALRKQGATSFIIDVRSNPGGLLTEAIKLSSIFLEEHQIIVQYEDRNGNITKEVASIELAEGFKVHEPVVILVDEFSASASEIFAAALKENDRAIVIGNNTLGKGSIQSVRQLDEASSARMTVLKWLTPKGNSVSETGLTPTIVETNSPYQKAIETFIKD